MSEMFMPSSSSRPYPRELELRWTGNGTPTLLSQKMTLSGTEGSKWLLMEYPPPSEYTSTDHRLLDYVLELEMRSCERMVAIH